MSRTITLIAALGAAFAVAVPAAWAERPDPRSEGLNRMYGLGQYSPEVRAEKLRGEALNKKYGLGQWAGTATKSIDARERGMTLQREDPKIAMLDARERSFLAGHEAQVGTGVSPDAFERAVTANGNDNGQVATGVSPDAFERAVTARGNGGVSDYVGFRGDDRFRIDHSQVPVPPATNSASSSGGEVEWPQVGIGVGIGIALILGLLLALRATRQRPLAH